jgi:hypothetical protein
MKQVPDIERRQQLIQHLSAKARAGERETADDRLYRANIGTVRYLGAFIVLTTAGVAAVLLHAGPLIWGGICAAAIASIYQIGKQIEALRQAFIAAEMAKGLRELEATKLYAELCAKGGD